MKDLNLYENLIKKLVINIKDIHRQKKLNITQTNINIKDCAEKQIKEMEFWTIRESLKKEK